MVKHAKKIYSDVFGLRCVLRVLHISTVPSGRGGIATVIRGYEHCGLIDGEVVRLVVTHADDGAIRKAMRFVIGLVQVLLLAAISPNFQVFHLHAASGISFYRKAIFSLIALVLRKRVVFHLHSGHFFEFATSGSRLRRWLIRSVLNRADVVAVVSSSWLTWLPRLIGHNRIVVFPNFVSSTANAGEVERRCTGLEALFLGDLIPEKGLPDLMKAWLASPLCRRRRLILHGRDRRGWWGSNGSQVGNETSVVMGGWASNDIRHRALLSARFLVLPSHAEGAPMVVIEAMAAGLPVIATRVGGIPDQVVDGETGFLIDVGDTSALQERMERLFLDDSLCRRMGIQGRLRYDQLFSPKTAVERVSSVYQDLL